MIELGKKYRIKPVFSKEKDGLGQKMDGTVVYIHPQMRYVVLEFKGPLGCARESFYPEQLEKNIR